jgi:prepilin-type N-terminal cleavage/methylation domain-containing protein
MKLPTHKKRAFRRSGFTLVEQLVVITIIVSLAAIIINVTYRLRARAESVNAFNHIRQSGMILLGNAQENNSRLELFAGGATGGFEIRAYNIVRANLGFDFTRWNNQQVNRANIMHWNPKKVKPTNFHWNCFAVNFTDMPDFGVRWRVDNGRPDGSNVRMLAIPTVDRPSAFPLLMDSSAADGSEIFRIGIAQTELPALRNAGKCHAFFLDGSARQLDKVGLKTAGFRTAYDTSKSPPKLTNL